MLPRSSRINSRTFAQVYPEARSFIGSVLILRFSTNKNLTKPLFSAVVSKKISTKAVTRNYLRRRIYSLLEMYTKNSAVRAGHYIFMAKKDFSDSSDHEIMSDIDFLIKKATI